MAHDGYLIKGDIEMETIDARYEALKRQFENKLKQTKTCWQRIGEILKREKATAFTFSQKTSLNDRFYYYARNAEEQGKTPSEPTMRTIMAIAAGYNLDLLETEELLKLSGCAFSPVSREHNAYIFIITAMCGFELFEKNEFLERNGFEALGSKPH